MKPDHSKNEVGVEGIHIHASDGALALATFRLVHRLMLEFVARDYIPKHVAIEIIDKAAADAESGETDIGFEAAAVLRRLLDA